LSSTGLGGTTSEMLREGGDVKLDLVRSPGRVKVR